METELLVLDAHTLSDLGIFETPPGGTSLFDFCNLTRTTGGSTALRRRMGSPWSSADRIAGTQAAISFIQAHREAFTKLPSAYATGRVDIYNHAILPMVIPENAFEFSLDALTLWANGGSHYHSIVRGVLITCKLIQTLRLFIDQATLTSPQGELLPLFEEMQALLTDSRLSEVQSQEQGGWMFKTLRLDQLFRLHEKTTVNRLLELIYEFDALIAMADVTSKHDWVLPEIEAGPLSVHAEGLIHPFVPNAVGNPVELHQQHRVLFLTGPNMAGKTTYIRAFAVALYLGHLGMGVAARSFRFIPAQRLFSAISLNDDLRSGISYFRAEALRMKAVAEAITDGLRVVAVMDEPFKGTNVKDALDASEAIMTRFAAKPDCLFMFSSHLIELQEQLSRTGQIDCRYFEAEEGEGKLRFDYLLHRGVSKQRLGMRVLREEGVFDLLDQASTEDSSPALARDN